MSPSCLKSSRLLEVASTKVFNVGQLVKLDWKLAMAVESSKTKNIETPYISVVAHVSDSTGKIVPHAFDMSFAEFNVSVVPPNPFSAHMFTPPFFFFYLIPEFC